MSDWKTLSSEVVYETPWFKVRRDQALNHHGKETTFSVIESQHPSVIIVATDAKGRIFTQKNYRYPLDRILLDIPAGGSDGEDFLVAAKRELLEEGGLASDNWTQLGEINAMVGSGNIPGTVFWAQNVIVATEARDDEEIITDQRFMELSELEQMIARGEVVDTAILAAIYMYKIHKEQTNV